MLPKEPWVLSQGRRTPLLVSCLGGVRAGRWRTTRPLTAVTPEELDKELLEEKFETEELKTDQGFKI